LVIVSFHAGSFLRWRASTIAIASLSRSALVREVIDHPATAAAPGMLSTR